MNKKDEMVIKRNFELTTIEEKQLYEDVRKILLEARERAYSNASSIMTQAYWNIGKRIIEQEQNGESKAKYGSYLIKNLSKEQALVYQQKKK